MPRIPKLKAARSPITAREIMLLIGLAIAVALLYKENERAQAMNKEFELLKIRVSSMLELEDKLRRDPRQKSGRMSMTDTSAKPHLHWTMAVDIVDEAEPKSPPAKDAAIAPKPRASDTTAPKAPPAKDEAAPKSPPAVDAAAPAGAK